MQTEQDLKDLFDAQPEQIRRLVAQGRNAKSRLEEIGRLQAEESVKIRTIIVRLRSRGLSLQTIGDLLGLSKTRVADQLRAQLGTTTVVR